MHHYRGQLEAERQQLLSRLASLTDNFNAVVAASRDTNADDEHDPEGATIAFERSQVGALIRQGNSAWRRSTPPWSGWTPARTAPAKNVVSPSARVGSRRDRPHAPASRARGRAVGDRPELAEQ